MAFFFLPRLFLNVHILPVNNDILQFFNNLSFLCIIARLPSVMTPLTRTFDVSHFRREYDASRYVPIKFRQNAVRRRRDRRRKMLYIDAR